MNSKEKGELAEAIIKAELMKRGLSVLEPVGESHRYDLVIDNGGNFTRIQCKSGRLRDGSILFNVKSINYNLSETENRGYHGDVDAFCVYCFDTEETYWVPIEDVGSTEKRLRVDEDIGKYNSPSQFDWAENYLLREYFPQ